jgi:ubiquinone/menaquinone biosynthesis C-methylase UbiE
MTDTPVHTSMDRRTESEMFNQMADYYDTFRPSYPVATIQEIITTANLSKASRVLEIGAGSGKATAQFAEVGFEMLCLDPGEDLVKIGNEKFGSKNIRFVASRFEEYPLPPKYYDAILSAQAFHWVPKPVGLEKCAATLKPNGYLLPFWNIEILDDTPFDKKLLTIIDRYDAFTSTASEANYQKRMESICLEIAESGYFSAPRVVKSPWSRTYTADEYYGYLLTGQFFIQQPPEVKRACYEELVQLAAEYGGITRRFICYLYVSQKL